MSLVTEKEEGAKVVLNKYWEELIEGNEKLRYSIHSKEAFVFLKKVFKYNQYERRDGSVADKVMVGDEIISDSKEVNKLIVEHLKSIQWDDKFPDYTSTIPFPQLILLVRMKWKGY